jgi:hypothetical protein
MVNASNELINEAAMVRELSDKAGEIVVIGDFFIAVFGLEGAC